MRVNDPRQDKREYATGNNENPLAEAPQVPRPDNELDKHIMANELRAIKTDWYPIADGPPSTRIPPRAKTWEGYELGATVQPQKWDIGVINILATPAMPQELWASRPSRNSLLVMNTGTVTFLVSPTEDKALNGIGISVNPGGQFALDVSGSGWVVSTGGVGQATIIQTWYEEPVREKGRHNGD